MQDPIAQRLRRIDYICGAALFALIACSVGAGIIPLVRARAHSLNDTQRLQTEINNLNDLSQTIGKVEADIKQAQLRLADEEGRLPTSQSMDQFVTELAKVADAAGLQVDGVSPLPLIDAPNYKVMPVKISGTGSYETCYKFLTGLRNMAHLTRLDDLQLQVVHDEHANTLKNPTCQITVGISTFVAR